MKKLNNKGITLVELIVSFALVSVSVIYFYQTVYTVRSLYSESQSDTQHYVKVNYALRLANELFTTGCEPNLSKNYKENVFLNAISTPPNDAGYNNVKYNKGGSNGFCEISFYIDTDKKDKNGKTIKKEYTLYKPPISIPDASSFNRNAVLLGGAHVEGEEGEKYIVFDGKDDFIQLPEIVGCDDAITEDQKKECVNWKYGFTVVFKAQFENMEDTGKLPVWGRIIDFGNGPGDNNIYISGGDEVDSLVIGGRYSENYDSGLTVATVSNPGLTTTHIYKLELANNNSFVYIDGVSKSGETPFSSNGNFWSSATRKINYIGKSNWTDHNYPSGEKAPDRYFKGKIYYITIDAYVGNDTTTKRTILDINANNFED